MRESDVDTSQRDKSLVTLLLVIFDVLPILENLGGCLHQRDKLHKLVSENLCIANLEEEIRLCLLWKATPKVPGQN